MNNYKLISLKIFLIIFLIGLITSCPNDQMRDLVEIKVSDPVADTFIINSGAPTSSRTVTLNSDVTKEEDALEMRFRNSGYSWSEWEAYSPAKTWILSIGDGTKTVYAEYRDEGHHVVSMANNIDLDTGAPAGPGFYVWGSGTETGQIHDYINTTGCTLFINVAGADRMRFSNNSVGNSIAEWDAATPTLSYADSYSWTLTSGDGSKTIYSQFLDAADNDSYFTYTITLDENSPSASSFQINNDDATANSIGATLTYNYSETNAVWAEYRNDGGDWSARESLSGGSITKSWGLRSETGTRTVYVRLKDIAGNLSSVFSDDIYLSTAAPAPPSVTSTTPTGDTTPTWNWNTVTGAVSYNYSLDSGSWTNTSATSYTAPVLAYGSHTLSVTSIDIAGNESASDSFTVNIIQPPDTPSGLSIGTKTNSSLALDWNDAARADSYRLYRDTSSSGSFSTQVYSGTASQYTDTGLSSGITYYYKVQAVNSGGNSSLSASVNAPTIPAIPAAPTIGTVTSTSIQINWTGTTGATSYQLYTSSSPTGTYVTQIYSGSSTTYNLTGLNQGRIYYFKVRATNASGSSTQSSSVQSNTTLPVPTSYTVSKGTSTAQVTISWDYVSGANQYYIERRTLSGSYSVLMNISGNVYNDTSAAAGTTYYYRVRARSADNVYSPYTTEQGGYRGIVGGKPNLIVSLSFLSRTSTSVNIIYRITNIGNSLADLDGPDQNDYMDTVGIQNYYSDDAVYNAGDRAAGGSVLFSGGLPESLPVLLPGEYYDHNYSASGTNTPGEYVVSLIDDSNEIDESNESDNYGSLLIP